MADAWSERAFIARCGSRMCCEANRLAASWALARLVASEDYGEQGRMRQQYLSKYLAVLGLAILLSTPLAHRQGLAAEPLVPLARPGPGQRWTRLSATGRASGSPIPSFSATTMQQIFTAMTPQRARCATSGLFSAKGPAGRWLREACSTGPSRTRASPLTAPSSRSPTARTGPGACCRRAWPFICMPWPRSTVGFMPPPPPGGRACRSRRIAARPGCCSMTILRPRARPRALPPWRPSRGRLYAGLTQRRQLGQRILTLTEDGIVPAPGWPDVYAASGLTAYRGNLFAVLQDDAGRRLWRSEGGPATPVAVGPSGQPLRALAAGEDALWAVTAGGGQGVLWQSRGRANMDQVAKLP